MDICKFRSSSVIRVESEFLFFITPPVLPKAKLAERLTLRTTGWTERLRKDSHAHIPILSHGLNTKRIVIPRHAFDRKSRYIADSDFILPKRCRRLAPDYLIPG